MMMPLQMRNNNRGIDQRAQQLYATFRPTPFDRSDADNSAEREPGSIFHTDANSIAARIQRKTISLYKTPRNVNPTSPPAVDAFYDTNEIFEVASLTKKKGNHAATLQSTTPRFDPGTPRPSACERGPGRYSPEKFTGAFPILADRITPSTVRNEKRRARDKFERAFAILPSASTSSPTAGSQHAATDDDGLGRLMTRSRRVAVGASATVGTAPARPGDLIPTDWHELQSSVLQPALTPKNAYSVKAKRQLLLLKQQ